MTILNADGEIIDNEIVHNENYGVLILTDEKMISRPRVWNNVIAFNGKSGIKCSGENNMTIIKSNKI